MLSQLFNIDLAVGLQFGKLPVIGFVAHSVYYLAHSTWGDVISTGDRYVCCAPQYSYGNIFIAL